MRFFGRTTDSAEATSSTPTPAPKAHEFIDRMNDQSSYKVVSRSFRPPLAKALGPPLLSPARPRHVTRRLARLGRLYLTTAANEGSIWSPSRSPPWRTPWRSFVQPKAAVRRSPVPPPSADAPLHYRPTPTHCPPLRVVRSAHAPPTTPSSRPTPCRPRTRM